MNIETSQPRCLFLCRWPILGLLVLCAYTSVQCKTQENKEQGNSTIYKENKVTIQQDTTKTETYNNNKTMLLKVEKIVTQERPIATLNYAVHRVGSQKVIQKGTYEGTDVQWNDTYSLKLIPYIGIERKPVSENPDEALTNKAPNAAVIITLKDSL